jgi:hypothetical protein
MAGKLTALKTNGKSITTAVTSYLGRVHGMGDPAEHELTALLHKIDTEAGKYDVGYVNQKVESARLAEVRRKEKVKADEAKRKQRAKAEAEREKARKGK